MPIEKEYKWIFKEDASIIPALISNCIVYKTSLLEQGYLVSTTDMSVRIRKNIYESFGNYIIKYVITTKTNVSGSVIEIEKHISDEDGEALFSVAKDKIRKLRTEFVFDKRVMEFDEILDSDNSCYIKILECEVKENEGRPNFPNFLVPMYIAEIKENDSSFNNCYLHDVQKVKTRLEAFKRRANEIPF